MCDYGNLQSCGSRIITLSVSVTTNIRKSTLKPDLTVHGVV